MEIKALIEMAQKGDKDARDRLVQENIGLVWSIVRRFSNRGYEIEDLFQLGCIGLIKAIDKFDNNFEVQFSTYAVPLIMGEIKRFMRDDGIVKISRTIKENHWKIKRAEQKLIQELRRNPTIEELSIETMIGKEDVIQALDVVMDVESIYKSVYQNDGSEIFLIDKICDSSMQCATSETVINNLAIEQVLDELGAMEKELIVLRYFKEKTQSEIADILGISQVQVSRLEKKILISMRKKMCS